jgi:hypothetical protein
VIPYLEIPSLFGIIHAFGVLVAAAILVGARMIRCAPASSACPRCTRLAW